MQTQSQLEECISSALDSNNEVTPLLFADQATTFQLLKRESGVDCHMLNSSSAAVDPSKIQISTIWNKEFFMR